MKNNLSVLFVSVIFLSVVVSGCIGQVEEDPKADFIREFGGRSVEFRANLTEADKVPVEPSEEALRELMLNPYVQQISVYYVPNETEDPFYYVSGFGLSRKLTDINIYYLGKVIPMQTFTMKEDERVINSPANPVIALVGPSIANETSVRIRDNLVVISGLDFSEDNRSYTDLDLAVGKFLLTLMKGPVLSDEVDVAENNTVA